MAGRLERDSLIVSGYIHCQKKEIPTEIILLCLKWYHLTVFFEFYEESRVEIMDDETMPSIIKYKPYDLDNECLQYSSCYGSVVMPSMGSEIYEYHVRFDKFAGVAIGICDAEFTNTDTFFYNGSASASYALWCWSGNMFCSGGGNSGSKSYAGALIDDPKMNDMVITYDPSNATLSYKINGKDYGVACNPFKSSEISYRLAMHVHYHGDIIIELK